MERSDKEPQGIDSGNEISLTDLHWWLFLLGTSHLASANFDQHNLVMQQQDTSVYPQSAARRSKPNHTPNVVQTTKHTSRRA